MIREQTLVDKAVDRLREWTKLAIKIERKSRQRDFYLVIDDQIFVVEVRATISNGNKASVFSMVDHLANERNLPVLLIVQYMPLEIAQEFAANSVNYLDIAGNCSIKHKNLIIQIQGKKGERQPKVNQARAFQEAGIRVIFQLLMNPENTQLTYRQLSRMADVSLGSVGNIMQELIDLNFILVTSKRKVLKNISSLLERWVIAYNDTLRPRLLLKRMRFAKTEQYHNWDTLPIQNVEDIALWGGEPAAALLTNHLYPEKFTIYTNNSWQSLIGKFKLLPDDNGPIEMLKIFWKEEEKYREKYIVPPLLIYADLMGSRIGRNLETAKIILENELSYLR